jgi:hypothetical protein
MHSGVPVEPATSESSRQLLEGIMSTPTKERAGEKPANRRTWVIGVAAVAALVLAVAAGLNLAGEGGGEPLALNAPADDPMAICIAFSPEQLAATAELAFEGTVTAVDGDTVTLSVDQWYLGGDDATEVVLNAPQGMEALIGGIPTAPSTTAGSAAQQPPSCEAASRQPSPADQSGTLRGGRRSGRSPRSPILGPRRPKLQSDLMAGSAESVVQVRDLRMRYGEVDVLDGVDFDVHRGEEVTQVEAAREQAAQWVR